MTGNVVEVVVRSPGRALQQAIDAAAAQAVREAEREVAVAQQGLTKLFGVPDPAVLLPPGPVAWETDRAWFHGGVRGLEAGELIMPWNLTGTVPSHGGGTGGAPGTGDVPGGCWITTDPAGARYYASSIPGGGSLYRIRPRGLIVDIEHPLPDAQLNTLLPWCRAAILLTRGLFGENCCVLAEVLEVAERHVPQNPYGAAVRALQDVPGGWPPLVHRKAARTPLPPPRDPAGPYRVCIVCHGNICRSPMAEAVLRDQIDRAGLSERVTVDSAGIAGERGKPMDPQARALLRRRGYDDGAAHRGRQFDPSWLPERDLILAMDADNLAVLQGLNAPHLIDRTRLFGEITGLGGAGIPNPYHGTDGDFALVLAMIETGMAAIVSQLTATERTTP
jgi:protein-tyrosine phosphatase